MIFIIFFITLLAISLRRHNSGKYLFFVSVLLMILYAGLKNNYSVDYTNYYIHFSEINSLFDAIHSSYEKLYCLLILVFKKLGLGFHTFLLFIAFVSIAQKALFIKKLSPIPCVSLLIYLLLFFIFNDVEQIRNGIAISFFCSALVVICQKKRYSTICALGLIILASLFHYSALFCLPLCLIQDKKFSKKAIIIGIAVCICISQINLIQAVDAINRSFLHISYISQKISLYKGSAGNLISATLLIKSFILIAFYIAAYDDKKVLDRVVFNTYLYGIMLTIAMTSFSIISARATIYMRYAEMIMIPMYIVKMPKLKYQNIWRIILLIIFVYYNVKFAQQIFSAAYFSYTSI